MDRSRLLGSMHKSRLHGGVRKSRLHGESRKSRRHGGVRKSLLFGIAASFFFSFTFLLNRSMNLQGGNWMWSACLRYFFMLLLFGAAAAVRREIKAVIADIVKQPFRWILWSCVGFGGFYASLCFASTFGASWFSAAAWEITIVAGILLTPLFGAPVPGRNLALSSLILIGIFLLQYNGTETMTARSMAICLAATLIAAFCYPLGNRKMMVLCGDRLGTLQRIFGMTLCSMPVWIPLAICADIRTGAPSGGQMLKSFLVALFSGLVATTLFFHATDLAKTDMRELALVEAAQCGEVIFTLLGGIWILGDSVPSPMGLAGIGLIVGGMILGSILTPRAG